MGSCRDPIVPRKESPKKKCPFILQILQILSFFGWNTRSYCHYLDTCLKCQVMMVEKEDLEGGGKKLALNVIVEWLIQPDSDLPWPLEFLICKVMNSLLFKPA